MGWQFGFTFILVGALGKELPGKEKSSHFFKLIYSCCVFVLKE
jgi:hypothetical protein